MQKKVLILTVVLFVFLSCCGFSINSRELNTTLFFDGNAVWTASYRISAGVSIKLSLLYGGDLQKMYEREYYGDPKTFCESVNADIIVDTERLKAKLDVIPVEPHSDYLGKGKFSYTEGKKGVSVDEKALYALIIKGGDVNIPYNYVYPTVTTDELKEITKQIAEFSTNYASSSSARKSNMQTAASRLDSLTVPQGGTVSFNALVGERTEKNGFLPAKVISYGEYAEGLGGGVCQVSTAFYNLWLKAGLTAKACCHSIKSSYVSPGLDAMVSETSDLILTNDSAYPVYTDVYYDGAVLKVKLYGKPSNTEVLLAGEFVKTIPCTEYEETEGSKEEVLREPTDGSVYKTVRTYLKDGLAVRTETLRTCTYPPHKGKRTVLPKQTPSDVFPNNTKNKTQK